MSLTFCDSKQAKPSVGLIMLLASLCFVGVIVTRRHAKVYSADPLAIERARAFLSSPSVGSQIIEYVHYGETYGGHQYLNTLPVYNANGRRSRREGFILQYSFRWSVGGVTDISFLCDKAGYVYDVQVLRSNANSNLPFENSKNTIEVFANDLLSRFAGRLDDADLNTLQKLKDEDDARAMLAWRLAFEQRSQFLFNM